MQTVNIQGKAYKCSKEVKEHIDWLVIQLKAKEKLCVKIEEIIEQMEDNSRLSVSLIQDNLEEIKQNFY